MEVLICKILIGTLTFNWVGNVEIESSWELLTDKATITLPANVKVDHNKLAKSISYGEKVTIKIGYNDNLNTVFTGYITNIKPKVPIEITCEDEMWKLKQNSIIDSGRNQTLNKLLKKHFSTYKTDSYDIEMGTYYIDKISGAKLLEQIKSDFGMHSFFRNDVLVVGRRYNPDTANHAKFKLDYNMVEDNLEYKKKDQVKIKVTAISNNSDGSKTEIQLGDPEGEARSLNFYNLSKTELKAAAERESERLIYEGWRGSFTAFGVPVVAHGDIVELIHSEESDKVGKYWVDEVKSTFGLDGYRQEIKLGSRV